MKKTLLALLILGAGVIAFTRLSLLANQSRTSATQSRAECARLASQKAQLTASATDLGAQVEAKKTQFAKAPPYPASDPDAANRLRDASEHSRPVNPAELLQRLGIGWNSSADYILVSKAALKNINPHGTDYSGTLAPTACAILSLSPEERAAIEAALKRAGAEYEAWLKTAVQRVEPVGDVLADYRLPANPLLAHQLQDGVMASLTETLDPERAELVRKYASSWRFEHGYLGESSVRFTVRRHTDGTQPPLWQLFQVQDGGSGSGPLKPGDFPDLFLSVFPGGWRDLAQREGFELPKEFE